MTPHAFRQLSASQMAWSSVPPRIIFATRMSTISHSPSLVHPIGTFRAGLRVSLGWTSWGPGVLAMVVTLRLSYHHLRSSRGGSDLRMSPRSEYPTITVSSP